MKKPLGKSGSFGVVYLRKILKIANVKRGQGKDTVQHQRPLSGVKGSYFCFFLCQSSFSLQLSP